MKKLLLLITIIFASYFLIGQVVPSSVYLIDNATTSYGISLNQGTLISDLETGNFWMLTQPATSSQSLSTTTDKIQIGGDSGEQPPPSEGGGYAENMVSVRSYGANNSCASDASSAFNQAFAAAGVVFVPAGCYLVSQTVTIPADKRIIFEKGAYLNVTGNFVGNNTELEAGLDQIFTVTSNVTGKWDIPEAYPEWFGAKGDSVTLSAAAITKTMNTFKKVTRLTGNTYLVEETIVFPPFGNMLMDQTTKLVNTSTMFDPFIFIHTEPFWLQGGELKVLHYAHMQGDVPFTGWVIHMDLKWPESRNNDFRLNSTLRDIRIVPSQVVGEKNRNGLIFQGVKVTAQGPGDKSYFCTVDNLYINLADTAFYIQGWPNEAEGGMHNSWKFSNYTGDNCLHSMIIGTRAWGHVFSNMIVQPYTNRDFGETVQLDIGSRQNVFHGMMWDTHADSTITFRSNAYYNELCSFGLDRLWRFIKIPEANIMRNYITAAPYLAPIQYYYGDLYNTNTSGNMRIGMGEYFRTPPETNNRLIVGGSLDLLTVAENDYSFEVSRTGDGNVPTNSELKYALGFTDDKSNKTLLTNPVSINLSSNSQVTLSVPEHLDARVLGKTIYRTKVNDPLYYEVASIMDEEITFVDNVTDANLGAAFDQESDATARGIYRDNALRVDLKDDHTIIKNDLLVEGRIYAAEEVVAPAPPYYVFDGTSGNFIKGKSGGLNKYPFTIYGEGIYQKGNEVYGMVATVSSTGTTNFMGLGFLSDNTVIVVRRNTTAYSTNSGVKLKEGQPYVVAAIFHSATEIDFYVNGNLIETKNQPEVPMSDIFTEFVAGAGRANATNYHLKGWLSVARLFDTAIGRIDIEEMKTRQDYIPPYLYDNMLVNFTNKTKTPDNWYDNGQYGNNAEVVGNVPIHAEVNGQYVSGIVMLDNGPLYLVPQDAPPKETFEGMMWVDGTDHTLKIYLSGAWKTVTVQ